MYWQSPAACAMRLTPVADAWRSSAADAGRSSAADAGRSSAMCLRAYLVKGCQYALDELRVVDVRRDSLYANVRYTT